MAVTPPPCDWGKGSYCATIALLDVTHGNITNFLTWQEAGYNQFGGCSWFATKINQIQGQPPTNNNVVQARRKSKIDFWQCMQHSCCGVPAHTVATYGCMDNGNMPRSYINNRGTWDFSLLNHSLYPGVVARPDGESLPGVQYGSAYPGTTTTPGTAAFNLHNGATVDDGSCFYPSELPYMEGGFPNTPTRGCMDSTPCIQMGQPGGNCLLPAGYADINGHGTAAVYDCTSSLTTPIIPDPCTPGSCVSLLPLGTGNLGYISTNYNPCANFSCPELPNSLPSYSSDYNHLYTEHEDSSGVGTHVFRPFGDTSCCDYTPPIPAPPPLEYNYRYGQMESVGGCRIAGDQTASVPNFTQNIIGEPFIRLYMNKFDVRLNRSAPLDSVPPQSLGQINQWNPLVPGMDWAGPPGFFSTSPPNPYKITIYDLNEQLIGSWTYSDINGFGLSCNGNQNVGLGGPDCYHGTLLSNPTPDPGTPTTFDLNDNAVPSTSPAYPLPHNIMGFQTLGAACPTSLPNPGPGVITSTTAGHGSGYPYYVLIENDATNGIKVHPSGNGWGSTDNLTNYAGTGVDMRFIDSTTGAPQTPISDFYYNNACCSTMMGTCWFYEWFAELPPTHPSFSITCDGSHLHPWYESALHPDCASAASSCYGTAMGPTGSSLKLSGECGGGVSNVLTIKI